MKKTFIAATLLFPFLSSASFARTLLTCGPNPGEEIAGGIASLELQKQNDTYSVRIVYAPIVPVIAPGVGSETTMPVVRVVDNNVSQKFVFDRDADGVDLMSLQANMKTKQAALVWHNSVELQFLSCR